MPRERGVDFLKIRVRATRQLRVHQVWDRIRRAARTRIVPDGIEILVLDWEDSSGARIRGGEYIGDDALDALRAMLGILKAGNVRVRHAE